VKILVLVTLTGLALVNSGVFLSMGNHDLSDQNPVSDVGNLSADSPLRLGPATTGAVLPFSTTIRNLSGREVTVQGVSSSCGCTEVSLSSMKIAPNDEVRLDGRVNSRRTAGVFTSKIKVQSLTDLGHHDELSLLVIAEFKAVITALPQSVTLTSRSTSPESHHASIEVTNVTAEPIKVRAVISAGLPVVAEPDHFSINPDASVKVRLSLAGRPAHARAPIIFKTANGKQVAKVDVTIVRERATRAEPRVIHFGKIRRSQFDTWEADNAADFTVTETQDCDIVVKAHPSFLTLASLQTANNNSSLSFSIRQDWDGRNPRGVIVLSITPSKGQAFTVIVPVTGSVGE